MASPPTSPPIGVPRVYDGAELPLLYPGEVASVQVSPEALQAALQHEGPCAIPVTGWLVEPTPGWQGWWLRLRYRIWGRWFSHGAPKLEIRTRVGDREEAS
jgi:hypothetical protein